MTKSDAKDFYTRLFGLALPIIGQNLLVFLTNFLAGISVGRLGDAAISGYFLGNQVLLLLQIAEGGIEATMVTLASQYLGAGDRENAKRTVSAAAILAAALSLSLTVVCRIFPSGVLSLFSGDAAAVAEGAEYLRTLSLAFIPFTLSRILIATEKCSERSGVALASAALSLAVNFILSRLLVSGSGAIPPLGIVGAAVAYCAAYSAELVLSAAIVFIFDKKINYKPKDLIRQNKRIFLDFVKYGLPIMAAQAIWAVNTFGASAIIGRIEKEGVLAGFSIAGSINNLSYTLINGLSVALAIIIGKAVASGNIEKIKSYVRASQLVFLAIGGITGLFLWLIRDPFIALWSASGEAAKYAGEFIAVLSVTIVATAYQLPMLSGVVRGGGDVSFVMKCDAILILLLVLPAALILKALAAPAALVFLVLKADHIIKCPIALIKVNRFSFIKNLTRDKRRANPTE